MPWESSQEEKEKYARAWMEKYIKDVLSNKKLDISAALEVSLLNSPDETILMKKAKLKKKKT